MPGTANSPLLELALKLEEIALEDEYFVERKLYPNVDFYSGIIYKALGIPRSMFTVMFAVGAHRRLGQPVAGGIRARIRRDRQALSEDRIGGANETSADPGSSLARAGLEPARCISARRFVHQALHFAGPARRCGRPSTGSGGGWRHALPCIRASSKT
jgi:hypothetical protein